VTRRLPLAHMWSSEKGLSAMLVFLCLALFVGAPLVATGKAGTLVFDILFSLLLVSGVVTIGRRPLLTLAVSVLTVVTLALRWVSFVSPDSAARIWSDLLSIVLLLTLATLVLVQVFREGPITGHRVQGAIVVYLLLGLAWSAAYEVVYYVLPRSFQIAQGGSALERPTYGLVYYSFITLTTVGYGDITPVHPVARSLAVAEALTGQLYLAILIARLVSMQISTRRKG
jgi:hypothetical protein